MTKTSEPTDFSGGPRVFIIIVTWNGLTDALECLTSLAGLRYPRWQAVVVDNGSEAGQADEIQTTYPIVTLIRNDKNLGYTGGKNAGIHYAMAQGADYIWLLNNDTVVTPNQFPTFNEVNYLLKSFEELSSRRALGVEVSDELNEVIAYSARYPSLLLQLTQWRPGRLRSLVGDLGVRRLLHYARDRWKWRGRRDAGRVRAGDAYSSFVISGRDFGFTNILDCAKFLDRLLPITDPPIAATGSD